MQVHNIKDTNRLSTGSVKQLLNNLWAICGAPVDCHLTSRMVEVSAFLMRRPAAESVLFYRNPSLALLKVSEYQLKMKFSGAEIFLEAGAGTS